MKTFIIFVVALIFIIGLRLWTGGAGNFTIVKISAEQAKKKLDSETGVVLLDVRTAEEYQQKHIPGSILIPLRDIATQAEIRLPDKNAEIIVYCRSGNRSVSAIKTLTKLGYTRVYDLGGIRRWPYKTISGK